MKIFFKQILLHAVDKQFVRFVAVGVFNTFFGFAVYVGLLYLGLHYTIAAFLSVAIGALFNFQTTGHFVFGTRHRSFLFKFCTVYLIIYLLKVTGLYVLLQVGINNYLGGAILIIPLAAVSFTLNKTWVFASTNESIKQ